MKLGSVRKYQDVSIPFVSNSTQVTVWTVLRNDVPNGEFEKVFASLWYGTVSFCISINFVELYSEEGLKIFFILMLFQDFWENEQDPTSFFSRSLWTFGSQLMCYWRITRPNDLEEYYNTSVAYYPFTQLFEWLQHFLKTLQLIFLCFLSLTNMNSLPFQYTNINMYVLYLRIIKKE